MKRQQGRREKGVRKTGAKGKNEELKVFFAEVGQCQVVKSLQIYIN